MNVYKVGILEVDVEENRSELIWAASAQEALALWRGTTGYTADAVPIDELFVMIAPWDWPGHRPVREPHHIGRARILSLREKIDGLELFRGYGFHSPDDRECASCGHYLPDNYWTERSAPDDPDDESGDDTRCDLCLASFKPT
jgi:hypothetical protein